MTQNSDSQSSAKIAGLTYLLSTFDGSPEADCQAFFDAFEAIATVSQWSASERLAILKTRLRGNAQKFFSNSPDLRKEQSYEVIKTKILEFFSDKLNVHARQSLFNTIQQNIDEPIKYLAHRVACMTLEFLGDTVDTSLEGAQKIIEKLKFTKFIDALLPEFKREVLKQNPQSFENALQIALCIENALKIVPTGTPNYAPNVSTAIFDLQRSQADTTDSSMKASEFESGETGRRPEHVSRPPGAQTTNVRFCLFCGKLNHVIKDCFLYLREKEYGSTPAREKAYPTKGNWKTNKQTNVRDNRGSGFDQRRSNSSNQFVQAKHQNSHFL